MILGVSVGLSETGRAQTRLGLHVTQEELNIWKQRAVSGPYRVTSDVQMNSPGDWTRIVNNAAIFSADPGADNVKGVGPHLTINDPVLPCGSKSLCGEIFSRDGLSVNDRVNVGIFMRDAAFYAMIKGPSDGNAKTYFSQVLNQLVAQAREPGVDPMNTTHWSLSHANDSSPFFTIALFQARWLLAYDYLKIAAAQSGGAWSISSSQRNILDTFFHNWAMFWYRLSRTADKIYGPSGLFTNPESEPHTVSGNFTTIVNQGLRPPIWKSLGGDGPQPTNVQYFNNRQTEMWRMVTLTGVALTGHPTFGSNAEMLKAKAKLYFRDWIKYAVFTNNDLTEMDRGVDDNYCSNGLSYSAATISAVIASADVLARSGDDSIYTYVTTDSDPGAGPNVAGAGKSLFKVVRNMMDYAGLNLFSPQRTCPNSSESGLSLNMERNEPRVLDIWMASGNLYWGDSFIQSTYKRTRSGTFGYPSYPTGCCGQPGWSAGSNFYPGTLFMFGQMEGKVWPYPTGGSPLPTINFAADPAMITDGQSSTLAWSTTNTTWCSASGAWTGAKAISGSQTITPAETATYSLSCTGSGGSDTQSTTVTVFTPGGANNTIAINAGGANYTSPDGTAYVADVFYSGGSMYSTTNSINNTNAATLYQTERYGNFLYAIPLANGDYTLTLQFAEIYWSGPGQRIFDVLVEGTERISNLDIYAVAGKDMAYDITLPVKVNDGVLNLEFRTDINNATLSGFKLTKTSSSAPAAPTGLSIVSQ